VTALARPGLTPANPPHQIVVTYDELIDKIVEFIGLLDQRATIRRVVLIAHRGAHASRLPAQAFQVPLDLAELGLELAERRIRLHGWPGYYVRCPASARAVSTLARCLR